MRLSTEDEATLGSCRTVTGLVTDDRKGWSVKTDIVPISTVSKGVYILFSQFRLTAEATRSSRIAMIAQRSHGIHVVPICRWEIDVRRRSWKLAGKAGAACLRSVNVGTGDSSRRHGPRQVFRLSGAKRRRPKWPGHVLS
jgi:hypothetical protein